MYSWWYSHLFYNIRKSIELLSISIIQEIDNWNFFFVYLNFVLFFLQTWIGYLIHSMYINFIYIHYLFNRYGSQVVLSKVCLMICIYGVISTNCYNSEAKSDDKTYCFADAICYVVGLRNTIDYINAWVQQMTCTELFLSFNWPALRYKVGNLASLTENKAMWQQHVTTSIDVARWWNWRECFFLCRE